MYVHTKGDVRFVTRNVRAIFFVLFCFVHNGGGGVFPCFLPLFEKRNETICREREKKKRRLLKHLSRKSFLHTSFKSFSSLKLEY